VLCTWLANHTAVEFVSSTTSTQTTSEYGQNSSRLHFVYPFFGRDSVSSP
jgi:hypothetical protein